MAASGGKHDTTARRDEEARSDPTLVAIVDEKIQMLRRRLLDFSRRNPLIHLTITVKSASHIRIVDELPDILRLKLCQGSMKLVALPPLEVELPDEQTRRFLEEFAVQRQEDDDYRAAIAKLDTSRDDAEEQEEKIERALRDRVRERLGLPPRQTRVGTSLVQHARNHGIDPSHSLPRPADEGDENPRHDDDAIQTLLLPDRLNKLAKGLTEKARSFERETGVNVLHAAFGILQWQAPGKSDVSMSPLVILECRIERRQTARGPEFHVAGVERAVLNTTLVEALASEHKLALPPFEEKTIEEYFEEVADLAPPGWDWTVRREASIGIFPSSRMAMYHDLDPKRRPLGSHGIVSRLLGVAGGSVGSYAEEYDTDAKEVVSKVPLVVLDADASQYSVLVDAAGGRCIALQGPPGSGKSQTIVNLIGAALADGKKVLFVAEKLTALDVVKNRLEAVGLGEFILPLQAGKGTSEVVYESLKARLDLGRGKSGPQTTFDRKATELEERRARMRTHLDALAAPFKVSGLTVHEVLGLAIAMSGHLKDLPPALQRLPVPGVHVMTPTDIDRLVADAGLLGARLGAAGGMPRLWREATVRIVSRDAAEDLCAVGADLADDLDAFDSDLRSSDLATMLGEDPWAADLMSVERALADALASAADPTLLEALVGDAPQRTMRELSELILERADVRADLQALLINADAPDAAARLMEAARFAEAENGRIDIAALEDLLDRLGRALARIEACLEATRRLPDLWADRHRSLDSMRETARAIVATPPSVRAYGLSDPMGAMPTLAREIADRRQHLLGDLAQIRRDLPRAGTQDPGSLLALASTLETAGVFRFLSSAYKAARAAYIELGGRADLPRETMGRDLRRLAAWLDGAVSFARDSRYLTVFGGAFRGVDTDPEVIAQLCNLHSAIGRAASGDSHLRQLLETTDPAVLSPLTALTEEHEDLLRFSRPALREKAESLRAAQEATRAAINEARQLTALFRVSGPVHLDRVLVAQRALARRTELEESIARQPGALTLAQAWPELLEDGIALQRLCDAAHKIGRTPKPRILIAALRSGAGEAIRSEAARLGAAREALDRQVQSLAAEVGLSWRSAADAALRIDDLRAAARDSGSLIDRGRLLQAAAALRTAGVSGLADWALREAGLGRAPSEERLATIMRGLISGSMARTAIAMHGEALEGFDGAELGRLRSDIAAKDREIVDLARGVIRNRLLMEARPPRGVDYGRKADLTELALIDNELNKKTRRVPPRELARRAGRAILELKPCWMMSPLAVSQYLHQGLIFDLVVIDEASQMTPENAIGALSRAGQAVVVGDTQQLPPTNFFQKVVAANSDEEEAEDVGESVLDLANLSFPVNRQLRWHYRSRDSSLIQFSNRWMYDGRLTIFPSPEEGAEDMGVSLVEIGGLYRAKTNPLEARAVVEAAVRHMAEHPDLSLGICTMNVEQKNLILEEFERERDRNPTVQSFVKTWEEKADGLEEFFVKNLETIQGDERDVMLISTLYGPESPGAKVHQRFGPVNTTFGHRRLNVLFTRAKRRIVTFTSLKPTDILSEGKAKGVQMFRAWLEYSRTREVATSTGSSGAVENPFEAHVLSRIEAMGFEGVPQVGASGYRIDIGVRHPDWPWGYILGIECDGASYHSSRSSRERDRLRQEILAGLGWRLHRIWSTDWYHDHDRAEERLRAALEEALGAARAKGPPKRAKKNVATFPGPLSVPIGTAGSAAGTDRPVGSGQMVLPLDVLSGGAAPKADSVVIEETGIRVGDRITVERLGKGGGRMAFTLVTIGHDPQQGRIGEHTPLGQALLGAEEGETVEYQQGSYVAEVRVLAVQRSR